MAEPRAIDIEFPPEYFEALAKVPERLGREMRRGLFRYVRSFTAPNGVWQRGNLRGRPGLFRRSGELARSFAALDVSSGETIAGAAALGFTTSKYARIHEFGGTILPKRGKYLVFRDTRTRAKGYVSVRSVTIPARMRWFESFQKDDGGRSIMLRAAIGRALGLDMGPQVRVTGRTQLGPTEPPTGGA